MYCNHVENMHQLELLHLYEKFKDFGMSILFDGMLVPLRIPEPTGMRAFGFN